MSDKDKNKARSLWTNRPRLSPPVAAKVVAMPRASRARPLGFESGNVNASVFAMLIDDRKLHFISVGGVGRFAAAGDDAFLVDVILLNQGRADGLCPLLRQLRGVRFVDICKT